MPDWRDPRETGGRGRIGHQRPGTYRNLEAIVHEPLLPAAARRRSQPPQLTSDQSTPAPNILTCHVLLGELGQGGIMPTWHRFARSSPAPWSIRLPGDEAHLTGRRSST